MVKEVKSRLFNTDKFISSRDEDTGEVFYGVLGKDLEAFVIDQQGDFIDEYDVIVKDLSDRNIANQDLFREIRLDHEGHYAEQKEDLRLARRSIEENYDGRHNQTPNLIENANIIKRLKNEARITKVYHSIPESVATANWARGYCSLISSTGKFEDVTTAIFHRHDILSQEPAKFWGLFPGDTLDISIYKNMSTPIYDVDENGDPVLDENGNAILIKTLVEKHLQTRVIYAVKTGENAFNPLETDADDPLIHVPITYVGGDKTDIVISSDPTTDDNLYLNLDDYVYYQVNVIPSLDLSQLVRIKTILNDIDSSVPIGTILPFVHDGSAPLDAKLPSGENGVWRWLTPPSGGNLNLPDATTYPEFNDFMQNVKKGSTKLTSLPDLKGRYIIGHKGTLNYSMNDVITKQHTAKPSGFTVYDNGSHRHTVNINTAGSHKHKTGSTSIADTIGKIKIYGSCKTSSTSSKRSVFPNYQQHRHTASMTSHTSKHTHSISGFDTYNRMHSFVVGWIIKVDHGTTYKRLRDLIP